MRYLIPLFLCAVVVAEESAGEKTEEERFEATVTALVHFKAFAGNAKVLHGDPRFVFTMKKDTGEIEHYAIHSVALFFREDVKTLVGKKFKFVRTRVFRADGTVLKTSFGVDREIEVGK